MSKSLVIVESPTKARTLTKFLGRSFQVLASGGHIMDLPKSKLGVDVDHDFTPQYVTIRGKAPTIKELKSAARKAKEVYLAPDPDREGEAIAWHLAQQLMNGAHDLKRLAFYEITKKAVEKALAEPRRIDMNMVNAQQARRVMDRLVGYQVSPLLWRTVRYGLSAGRVQSVALRMVVEREREILAFVAVEYWSIMVLLETPAHERFETKLVKIGGKAPEISDQATAERIVEELKQGQPVVQSVTRQEKRRSPKPPFKTSTLQQEAYQRLRFSSKKTMMHAQELYEGVDVPGEGTVGLITYMRTDSTRLAGEAVDEVRRFIQSHYGERYLPAEAPVYAKKSATTQDAHEAIRPTAVTRTPESLRGALSQPQLKLYTLIWNRFVSCQMAVAVFDVTTVDVQVGDKVLRATGTLPKFDGFLRVYGVLAENGDSREEGEGTTLPAVAEGDRLLTKRVTPRQHFTQPPPRYTEATIIKVLEAAGIGRPSTYATIVSTILNRDYVIKEKGALKPTDLGMTVTDLLLKNFPDIFEVEFTARMEEELDKVETGEDEWVKVVRDFYTPFAADLVRAEEKTAELKQSVQQESEVVCEACGRNMVKKYGRNGPFLACPGYPECRNTKPLEGEAPAIITGEVCSKCSSPMVVRSGRFGRFLACSAYPECKTTASFKVGVACPEDGCTGQLVEKRSRRGKMFYGCDRYPDCKFALWQRPVPTPCIACGVPFMVYRETKAAGPHYYCSRCKAVAAIEAETTESELKEAMESGA
jgi:DNA topoisomerase-1